MPVLLALVTLAVAPTIFVHEDGHFVWPVECGDDGCDIGGANYSPGTWGEAKDGMELVVDFIVGVG